MFRREPKPTLPSRHPARITPLACSLTLALFSAPALVRADLLPPSRPAEPPPGLIIRNDPGGWKIRLPVGWTAMSREELAATNKAASDQALRSGQSDAPAALYSAGFHSAHRDGHAPAWLLVQPRREPLPAGNHTAVLAELASAMVAGLAAGPIEGVRISAVQTRTDPARARADVTATLSVPGQPDLAVWISLVLEASGVVQLNAYAPAERRTALEPEIRALVDSFTLDADRLRPENTTASITTSAPKEPFSGDASTGISDKPVGSSTASQTQANSALPGSWVVALFAAGGVLLVGIVVGVANRLKSAP